MESVPRIKSHADLVAHIQSKAFGRVNARDWAADWQARWIVYADLIAFTARARRSKDVVLNNIVRFGQASTLAESAIPNIVTYRFSDSTFAVASSLREAIAFAAALHHACLAINTEYLQRRRKRLFIHMIVPRITIGNGEVLTVSGSREGDKRFTGLDAAKILVGDGVVKACQLEHQSAGGLLTFECRHLRELSTEDPGSHRQAAHNGLARWLRGAQPVTTANPDLAANDTPFFIRDRLVDFPWLLLQPFQPDGTPLAATSTQGAMAAAAAFIKLWQLSNAEYYSAQGAASHLDTHKHCAAAMRHATQVVSLLTGSSKMRYMDPQAALDRTTPPAGER